MERVDLTHVYAMKEFECQIIERLTAQDDVEFSQMLKFYVSDRDTSHRIATRALKLRQAFLAPPGHKWSDQAKDVKDTSQPVHAEYECDLVLQVTEGCTSVGRLFSGCAAKEVVALSGNPVNFDELTLEKDSVLVAEMAGPRRVCSKLVQIDRTVKYAKLRKAL